MYQGSLSETTGSSLNYRKDLVALMRESVFQYARLAARKLLLRSPLARGGAVAKEAD